MLKRAISLLGVCSGAIALTMTVSLASSATSGVFRQSSTGYAVSGWKIDGQTFVSCLGKYYSIAAKDKYNPEPRCGQSTPPPIRDPKATAAVASVVKSSVESWFTSGGAWGEVPVVVVDSVTFSGPFALAAWQSGGTMGQAVVEWMGSNWKVLKCIVGRFTKPALTALGIEPRWIERWQKALRPVG